MDTETQIQLSITAMQILSGLVSIGVGAAGLTAWILGRFDRAIGRVENSIDTVFKKLDGVEHRTDSSERTLYGVERIVESIDRRTRDLEIVHAKTDERIREIELQKLDDTN